jgi:hypothetical protein
MGVRAVIVVRDGCGHERRFWAPWASSHYQIQFLARFIHAADHDGTPLTVGGYLAYTQTHPDTLPARDITDDGSYADPAATGDLDHRYLLLLDDHQRTFRYVVYERLSSRERRRWKVSHDLASRGDLYGAAARMCRHLATNSARYRAANNGIGLPGDPGPDFWREQEQEFTAWTEHLDPRLLGSAGPTPQPPRYTLAAARTLTRQVNTQLRQLYPGVTIRTRLSQDGLLTMTVPARLAADAETARITQLVSGQLGQLYTVRVRAHRRSRYGGADTGAAVNATLVLHAVPATSAGTADAEHRAIR